MVTFRVVVPDEDYYRKQISCRAACPILSECHAYVQAIAASEDERAYALARLGNPFAYVLGRICAHPCEEACRRGAIDAPVAICALKRFATDHHNLGLGHDPSRHRSPPPPKPGKRVAVVGAGPCGLTCAHDLALWGYDVEVFESAPVPGGMLYMGVPHYRLPREIIDMEVQQILALGIRLHLRTTLGRDLSWSSLRSRFDAVMLATGLSRGREMEIPGTHLDGVLQGIDFLINANLGYQVELGPRVVVLGSGNVAVDVARSALRLLQEPLANEEAEESRPLAPTGSTYFSAIEAARMALRTGARSVRLLSLEPREKMSAYEWQVREAEAEGVLVESGWGAMEILGEGGRASGLRIRQCLSVYDEEGRFVPAFGQEERYLACESVVLAIGQQADLSFLTGQEGVGVSRHGYVCVDPELGTSAQGVFAGGDVAFGPRLLVDAVADGHRAARSIHRYLGGESSGTSVSRFRTLAGWNLPTACLRTPRQPMPSLPTNRRIGIAEVELGYDDAAGRAEASRCLSCQVNTVFDSDKCILCNLCVDICPESCLRLADLSRLPGSPALDALVRARFGAEPGSLRPGTATAILKDETRCTRCALCAQRCPTGAITMEALEDRSLETMARR